MTNMSADKAGNSLLQLPQEIKNEIYSHYFDKSYLVLWSSLSAADNDSTFWEDEPQSPFRDVLDSNTRGLADFAILRTCKSINSDAQDILYSRATTFIYSMRFDYEALHTTPPVREATDRMMNVEFRVNVFSDAPISRSFQGTHDQEQHQFYSRMEATCGATLDRFAGTSVTRDSFRITFQVGFVKPNTSIGRLIESPFVRTLEKFIGFQSVVVELISAGLANWAPDKEAEKTVRNVQKAFEPHLGPSIERVGNITTDSFFGLIRYMSVEIEFEPQKFHIEKLRASKL